MTQVETVGNKVLNYRSLFLEPTCYFTNQRKCAESYERHLQQLLTQSSARDTSRSPAYF
jgi:hypothetical protein